MCEPRKLTVYVLRSAAKPERHYVGLTANLQKRIAWHNAGQNVHTARDRPWTVVVSLEFAREKTAMQFERYLKSGSGRAFAKRHFAYTPSNRLIQRPVAKFVPDCPPTFPPLVQRSGRSSGHRVESISQRLCPP